MLGPHESVKIGGGSCHTGCIFQVNGFFSDWLKSGLNVQFWGLILFASPLLFPKLMCSIEAEPRIPFMF